ncbi:MAG: hypothetical protein E7606_03430 [Ruminococcaceae bacterium]|nr:hypothetical protein [Oscillospiraceae bacterium]
MKKLSLLILLMLCITISGVYAAWIYAGTNDIADVYTEAKVTIADVELQGANGTYHISSNLVLTVDQKNENHEAELVFASNNTEAIFLKVTFTPAANAPQTIKENAVPTEIYYTVTTPMQYKMDADGNYLESGTPTDIFTFSNPSDGYLNNTITWTEEGDGTFSYTMNETDLKAAISLSQTFVLDTKAEHDAFGAALAGNIVVRVTDGTVN